MNDYCGVIDISGNQSMYLFKNVFDEDFSALYKFVALYRNVY